MIKFVRRIDFLLLLPALLLSALGLLMIYSISFESDPSFFIRQLIFIGFSVGVYLAISSLDYKVFSHLAWFFYAAVIVILVLTLAFGLSVRGSTRWLDLGFVTLQGSELVKPVLVLALAGFLSKKTSSSVKNFLVSVGLVLIPVFLIARQPDLSSSLILLAVWVFMVFIAGVNIFYLIVAATGLLVLIPLLWNFVLEGYQKARILTFLNPGFDPQGASYNIIQALIALGSGQLAGRGLGRGTQSHLNFLPEGRTDFIFAVTGEELGFVGLGLIILIFSFLIYRIVKISTKAASKEGAVLALSAAFLLIAQFFVNAGMNMGLFPVSGITLPFVSFGGSSILSLFILLGLVQLVSRDKRGL